ncbi:unnamed protein product [Rhizoctonia solani]|uniref:F-box domain-containing protein n=1 Tax=Rhizoctonia solani TaxID=456999 RepID=A0A8H3BNW0_9AGAM|nr:unnamed protein product [Rhizoctonia solani]
MNLPMDVFVNIASYFQSQDLLALTRVNTFLRRLLMSCKSEPMWRSARQNVIGLPPCPKELSEPVYAALLFSKICTSCGCHTLQNMDPVLLEKLCGKCKKTQLMDLARHKIDTSLVFTSAIILPGHIDGWPRRGPWCFNDDAQTVKAKLATFDEAGNEEAKRTWIQQRRDIVNAREQSAEPLRAWFQLREIAKNSKLHCRKEARKTEIENRLERFGYDKRDMDFRYCGGWFSYVYNASPLTDKVWRELLPELLKIVKANRRKRIESERADRLEEINDWFFNDCNIIYFSWPGDDGIRWELNAIEILMNNLETLPEVKRLLDKDQSPEDFKQDFELQKPMLADILVDWVNAQEARLVSTMPDDVSVPDFDFPDSTSTVSFEINDDSGTSTAPMDTLPINTRKLLRADAVFAPASDPLGHTNTCIDKCYFYPSFDGLPDGFTYSKLASEIAKNLLNSLGRPDATYLEMMSKGHELGCGMCPEIQPLGWKDLIEHCLKEHWAEESDGYE